MTTQGWDGAKVNKVSLPALVRSQTRSSLIDVSLTLSFRLSPLSFGAQYVQFATLNGKPFTRNWISHQEFFLSGATLHLVLGSEPTSFGSTKGDLPPSLSAGAFQFATAGHGL